MSSTSISSVAALRDEVAPLKHSLSLPETEETWDAIFAGISSLMDICSRGGCDFPTEFVSVVRSSSRTIVNAMMSERTRLSGMAIDFVGAAASGLGSDFEPLLPTFLPVLLSLCGRVNKVTVSRARSCIFTIIESTQLPAILPWLLQSIAEKSSTLRLTVAEGMLTCMNCFNPPDLEKDVRARDVEAIIRATARDAHPDVRKTSRKIFEAYKVLLPNRVERFTAPLTPTMKKYLEVKAGTASKASQASTSTKGISDAARPTSASGSQATQSRTAKSDVKQVSDGTRAMRSLSAKPVSRVPSTNAPPNNDAGPLRPPTRAISSRLPSTNVTQKTLPTVVAPQQLACPASSLEVMRPDSSRNPVTMPIRNVTCRNPLGKHNIAQSYDGGMSGPRRIPLPEAKARPPNLPNRDAKRQPSDSIKPRSLHSRPQSSKDNILGPLVKGVKPGDVKQSSYQRVNTRHKGLSEKLTHPKLSPHKTRAKQPAGTAPGVRRGPATINARTKTNHLAKHVADRWAKRSRPATPALVPLPPSPSPPQSNTAETETNVTGEVVTLFGQTLVDRKLLQSDTDKGSAVEDRDLSSETAEQEDCKAEVVITDDSQCMAELFPPPHPLTPRLQSAEFLTSSEARTPISALLHSIQQGFLFTRAAPGSRLESCQSFLDTMADQITEPLQFDTGRKDIRFPAIVERHP